MIAALALGTIGSDKVRLLLGQVLMQLRFLNDSFQPTFGLIVGLSSALTLIGCGKGEYDARLDNFTTVMSKRAANAPAILTTEFFPVTDPANKPIGFKFKLPTLFTGSEVKSLGADTARAKLMKVDLPGFCYTMERPLADDSGKNIPAYCYLFVINKTTGVPDDFKNQILAAITPIDGAAAWTDAPPAGTIPVRLLKATGNLEFEINGAMENLPGQIEVYSLDAGANQVFVGWRAATSSGTKHKVFDAVRASMATAQIDAPAPAPTP